MLKELKLLPRKMGMLLVRGYQLFISPALPVSCIHNPSCSQYAILAIEKHGLMKGCWLAFLRILSCRPNAKVKNNDYP